MTDILSYPWTNRVFYAEWLAQTHFYTTHSTRLLARAASQLDFSEVGQAWHKRFCSHLSEEHGHEQLALKDLAVLGLRIEQFIEFTETTDFYALEYYRDPYLFMGYVLALEEIAADNGLEIVRLVDAPGADLFLRVHSVDDLTHVLAAHELVNMLPEARRRELYLASGEAKTRYFAMLDRCAAESR